MAGRPAGEEAVRKIFVRLKWWKAVDWWELELPHLICKVIGHKTPPKRKFKGELLCPRCSAQVGRWR